MSSTARRALVTNDDGVGSDGIAALARVAHELELEVLVAAPASNVSGVSASLAGVSDDGRLVVEKGELAGVSGMRVLAVQAAPAMIVRAALNGAFDFVPDVVLSGINDGPNTGHSVLHSGTVGAALTAVTSRISAAAFSIGTPDGPPDFRAAVEMARTVIPWILAAPPVVTLNVNVPSGAWESVRGVRAAPLATFGAVQTSLLETGEGHVTLEFEDVDASREPDTDAALLAEGWVTLTALRAISEATDVDLSRLVDGTAQLP